MTTTFMIEAMASANAQLRWKRREQEEVSWLRRSSMALNWGGGTPAAAGTEATECFNGPKPGDKSSRACRPLRTLFTIQSRRLAGRRRRASVNLSRKWRICSVSNWPGMFYFPSPVFAEVVEASFVSGGGVLSATLVSV